MIYLPYVHMLCMITAVILIMTAVMIVRRKKAGWFVLHRKMASMGALSALIGFIAEFSFKTIKHYPHIQSPHAIAGIVTLTLVIITPIIGAQIASKPEQFKKTHQLLGKITAVAVALTALMGIARFIQLSRNT